MASKPEFANKPRQSSASLIFGNTNRDGSGTIENVLSAGPAGSRVERVRICATGVTTAGMVRLFVHDGVRNRLIEEITVAAITPTASVKAFRELINFPGGLILPPNYSLRAATHQSEGFHLSAEGGDF
ncbi:MAG TPA: hypothetical protein PKC68_06800 [Alphaproteobacteria bacterium]|jgi:hypothetical protein|nr:hypothetical protein [Alphaproteobacteria bacterium]